MRAVNRQIPSRHNVLMRTMASINTMLSTTDLLKKYDVPGPRYTSYPTAPIWTESVNSQDYKDSLQNVKGKEPLSLYFHLPFCENLCHFCGCMQVITKDHSRSKPYVDLILNEIKMVTSHLNNSDKVVSQIHFGGGTPNFLQPEEISLIMQSIRKNFRVLPDAEIAIEMHPRTSTQSFCEKLKVEQFNRISLGVQSFDNEVQKLINRYQTYEMTKDMVASLRELGFKHYNFDLIYGLPGQDIKKFEDTLEKTLTLKPNRLAVYSYAHVPWVRPVQRSFNDDDLPTPQLKLKLFETALKFFLENGYHMIGMDHFADENDELTIALKNKSIHRNFMGYTTRADAHQIGFGVSSISYVNGNYFQNQKKLKDYQEHTQQNQFSTLRGFILSRDDKIRRALITQLMCHLHIDIQKFEMEHELNFHDYFKDDLKHLKPFQDDDLLDITNNHLSITSQGHLVIRNMSMCFDRYLEKIRKNSTNPVFSRTV